MSGLGSRVPPRSAKTGTAVIRKPKGPTALRRAARRAAKLRNYAKVCQQVDQRDKGCCRVCRVFRGTQHHHIIFRSQGGPDTTGNLILVCDLCHEHIHNRRVKVSGDGDGEIIVTNLRLPIDSDTL